MDDENIDDTYDIKVIDYIALTRDYLSQTKNDPDESIAIEMEPIINSTPSHMGSNDFLFSRFIVTPQETLKGLEAVQNLEIAEIAQRAGIYDDNSTVDNFLSSLKDAYILMVTRIMERYDEKAYRAPRNYPEFDIYDSVHELIETDELEELTHAFSEGNGCNVSEVSSKVYGIIDELFCGISEWNDVKIKEYRDSPPSIY